MLLLELFVNLNQQYLTSFIHKPTFFIGSQKHVYMRFSCVIE